VGGLDSEGPTLQAMVRLQGTDAEEGEDQGLDQVLGGRAPGHDPVLVAKEVLHPLLPAWPGPHRLGAGNYF